MPHMLLLGPDVTVALESGRASIDTVKHPEVRVATSFFSQDNCAICGREWDTERTMPFPTAYTVESIDAGDPPQPVCDDCIHEHYPPDVVTHLQAERRYFEAN